MTSRRKKAGRSRLAPGQAKILDNDSTNGKPFVKQDVGAELDILERWLNSTQPAIEDFGVTQPPSDLYGLTQKVSLICDRRGIEAEPFTHICRLLIACVRPDEKGWAGPKPDEAAVVDSFRRAHTLYQRLVLLLRQEAEATKTSAEVAWDENDPNYIPASEACITFTESRLSLGKLSRLLTPDGAVRYMKKGRRCRVHIADFRTWAQQQYPPDSVRENIADDLLADRVARKREIDRQNRP